MRSRWGSIRFGLWTSLAIAVLAPILAAGCSGSPSVAPSPAASPSTPQVVATVSAATPQRAFRRYVTDRISHMDAGLPSGSWDSHQFGPESPDSATFELTVRFTLENPIRKLDSWATYSVTRGGSGQAWTITRISPPVARVLPTPVWGVGP
jgi:hypothetical protein